MLTANSAAIVTDAFPEEQRGFALGINQVSAMAGQFIGLVLGGLLAAVDWRAVFWINVPVGIFGTIWAFTRLREVGTHVRGRIDWWGNITFAVGLGSLLIGVTFGIQPYHSQAMGWTRPSVLTLLIGGLVMLGVFAIIETRVADPMFQLELFRIRVFTAGNIAAFASRLSQGGLQFMLVIWLQDIWLPLHGYSYDQTPLWAGIYLLPLTLGFMVAGPTAGYLSDRVGACGLASAGMVIFGLSFLGLMVLPVDFSYPAFAVLILINGVGMGMFSAPNTAAMMSSVPASQRGVASGMRATFQNSGIALSIGVFFSLMITGLASSLPNTLTGGLVRQGVPQGVAHHIASLPPVSSLFAAVLGVNPLKHLLEMGGVLARLPSSAQATLTSESYFPHLISAPFSHGLTIVFAVSAGLSFIAAAASMTRDHDPRRDGATSVAAPAHPEDLVALEAG